MKVACLTALAFCVSALHHARGAVVQFTAGEGFTAGAIDGQVGWEMVNGDAGTFTVNPPGLSLGLTNDGQAIYQTAQNFALGAVTSYVDFNFVQNTTALGVNQGVIGMQYLQNGTSGNLAGTAGLFGRTPTGYRLALGGATTTVVLASDIGIDTLSSDLASANLRLVMTLTRTSTADSWTRALSLVNLDSGNTVASIAPVTYSDATAYADPSLYASISNQTSANTNLVSLGVTAFGIEQVPEPGAVALVLCAPLLGLYRRRRAN